MSRLRLRSIKNRLALLFFIITASAIGIVYFYVVPQLESSLIDEKLSSLQSVSNVYSRPLQDAIDRGLEARQLDSLVRRVAQRAGTRVTLLGVENPSARTPASIRTFVIADSQRLRSALNSSYVVATRSVLGGRTRAGTDSIDDARVAMAATPLALNGRRDWVAVFSSPLQDVIDNVGVIQAKILVAGGIGLFVALIAGYFAARTVARRVKRLEEAAEDVAAGRFGHPILVDSEDELGELARAFNEMQRQVARLDVARKEFIAKASHELRTPLFSLGGFVELLQDEDLDPETREEFLKTMREQVDRLTKLATDLLDLSRLDAGALELQAKDVDLGDVARSVIQEFGPVAGQHKTRIDLAIPVDQDIEAYCDAERVAQIVRILLDNAITHTPTGTRVTVSADTANGAALLSVADNGPGITDRDLDQIFERFHSADSSSGTGLGLAIAQELAEHMDGSLDVSSASGRTTFTLQLPVGQPD